VIGEEVELGGPLEYRRVVQRLADALIGGLVFLVPGGHRVGEPRRGLRVTGSH
jgi:hypothetical protein